MNYKFSGRVGLAHCSKATQRITAAIFFLLLASVASAQDFWQGGTGSWFSAANWTAGVPGAATDAVVNNGGTAQIVGADAFASNFSLGNAASATGSLGLFTIGGAPSTLTIRNFLVIGGLGEGAMNLTGVSSVTNVRGFVGSVGSSTGTVQVSGPQAIWTNSASLNLGSGVMIISAGGRVSSLDVSSGASTGRSMEVRVTGAGSTLTVTTLNMGGFGGSDFMSINQGGRVEGRGVATIGAGARVAIGNGGEPGILEAERLVVNGTLAFNHSGATTLAPDLFGSGNVTKEGPGATTIRSATGFTGTMSVESGELILTGNLGAGTYIGNSSGTLRIDAATLNLGAAAIRANAGAVIGFTNSTVIGGFLRGPGTHLLNEGPTNTFRGVTTFNSTNIVQNGTAVFTDFTNGGSLVNNANSTLELDGAVNASSGVLTVNHSILTRDFTNNGVFTVKAGAIHDNVTTMVAGGGSRTTVDAGGVVFISDEMTLEVNGGLLVNRGTINGTVNVNFGSLATGDGVFSGAVNVNQGGRFSPGNSPGSATVGALTLNAGGSFAFEINDADGAPGTGFDLIRDIGALIIGAGSTQNARFTIEVVSLDAANDPGLALNFDPSQPSSFTMISAEGGIQGFDPALFFVDTSGFQNDLTGGSFSVVEAGNDLLLTFSPVPEPSTTVLLLAASSLALRRRRSPTGS